MPSYTSISVDKLSRLIGTANTPVLIDVRTDEDFAADPRILPGALRRPHEHALDWAKSFAGQSTIVICRKGQKLAEGAAAWLRHAGAAAETLDGGFEAWRAAKLPTIPVSKLPPPDPQGRTVWVTRSRPKDRSHCVSLAHTAFRRPKRSLPVRCSFGGRSGRRTFRRGAVRHRERVLEPSRRSLHVRHHDRGVRALDAAARSVGDDGACRRHRSTRTFSGGTGLAGGLAGIVPHVR